MTEPARVAPSSLSRAGLCSSRSDPREGKGDQADPAEISAGSAIGKQLPGRHHLQTHNLPIIDRG